MTTFRQLLDVKVRMRDGVRLSCDIRYPARGGPFPVVLLRTPYGKETVLEPSRDAILRVYLAAGYAYVVQDVRGRYESEGEFVPFQEAYDGEDTIEWLARQPWSSGEVGMTGASFMGFTQLDAARAAPGPLKAIAPSVIGYSMFRNIARRNGVPDLGVFAWGLCHTGRTKKTRPVEDWDALLGVTPLARMAESAGVDGPVLKAWLSHSVYDAYWEGQSLDSWLDDMRVPCFHMGGWYDLYSAATVQLFERMAAASARRGQPGRVRLLMGPWAHALASSRVVGEVDFGPESLVPVEEEKRRWLDRYVKGEPNGIDREPPVRLFVMGINRWRDENHWPLERTVYTPCYLGSRQAANSLYGDGSLGVSPAGGGRASDEYVYDPARPVPSIGGQTLMPDRPAGPFDQRPAERRDDVLVFTGDALGAPLEVTGPVRLELHVSSSAPDTDFVARLCDVYPDGRSINLCDGIARARFREGLDREVMLEPGRVYRLDVDMDVTSNVFLTGHRVRLEITSSCFPRWARNLNTGGDISAECECRVARQVVYHSPSHPSRLILPVIPG